MPTRLPHHHRSDVAVHVGRPGKWGNPFLISDIADTHPEWDLRTCRQEAVTLFTALLLDPDQDRYPHIGDIREELAGRDLHCWCPLTYEDGTVFPCHGDVLLRWANTT